MCEICSKLKYQKQSEQEIAFLKDCIYPEQYQTVKPILDMNT